MDPIILSDEEDPSTPFPFRSKKRRTEPDPNRTVFVIEDDPTPKKSVTPSIVPETPMSALFGSEVAIVKCTMPSVPTARVSPNKISGISQMICLESDNESEHCGMGKRDETEPRDSRGISNSVRSGSSPGVLLESGNTLGNCGMDKRDETEPRDSRWTSNSVRSGSCPHVCLESDNELENCRTGESDENEPKESRWTSNSLGSGSSPRICLDSDNELENFGVGKRDQNEARDSRWTSDSMGSGSSSERHISHENATQTEMLGNDLSNPTSLRVEKMDMEKENTKNMKKSKVPSKNTTKAVGKTKVTKEERSRLMEEKKLQKEQEKLKKAALKAEAAELKKIEKEKQKWEKGKFAIKSIVAEIDAKVVETGSIGGHLLTRFAEKGLTYHITSNPISGSILWSMKVPEQISQLSTERIEIPYVLLIYEADKFCNLVMNDSLFDQLSSIRSLYPSYTVCYLTNRLLAYINKREQEKYKNPENNSCWRRPPIEEVLAKLTTNFNKVHSRLCVDEAELAEHVAGLTCSLASCQFRKKLTRLSVYANGALIPKDCVDRNLIKKSLWLKGLVSIPKVQPRFAIAIWKKYPTMKSLLSVYMDPSKSEHEKEFLLKDLMTEGLVGGDRRLGEVCSKRVYRILMAQSGSIRTDDVENGADFFERQ
ncbi:crossover junction endonuclease EME1B-like [Vigna umbellata]|uniref:crossover junction endonuclease EME1B-like n=1 Tax=Vigna umbellata TaxID=87088 RepID=UPI001F5F3D48|nr:crossover junction endonuclease EME1B-like [Vigna umbellata]XP_047181592.1 crossover junction endonuclease EME1B-like [Vigna umbellata]XP_047181600.1 crossover junction endonuclease EME1B-like [Vigna umbellata]